MRVLGSRGVTVKESKAIREKRVTQERLVHLGRLAIRAQRVTLEQWDQRGTWALMDLQDNMAIGDLRVKKDFLGHQVYRASQAFKDQWANKVPQDAMEQRGTGVQLVHLDSTAVMD